MWLLTSFFLEAYTSTDEKLLTAHQPNPQSVVQTKGDLDSLKNSDKTFFNLPLLKRSQISHYNFPIQSYPTNSIQGTFLWGCDRW